METPATQSPGLSPVSPTSRRIFRYWLLLLVPTLLAGGGAILLLRREQNRLAEQSATVDESRRAALAARTRLIAENVELLIGDVEAGLFDTLGAAPAAGLERFLEDWEKTNPLVRVAFRATADGRLLWPAPGANDEEARGFVRRFPRLAGNPPPWRVLPASALAAGKTSSEDKEVRKVASNVAQVQSARRDVQELFKTRESNDRAGNLAMAPAAGLADAASVGERRRGEVTAEADAYGVARSSIASTYVPEAKRAGSGANQPAVAAVTPSKDAATATPHGWISSALDGRQHVLGWMQSADTPDIRGVEVELAALISRLGAALPVESGLGEGYALRDEQGRVMQQAGSVPRAGTAQVRVPLAAAMLPGWDVVAFLAPAPGERVGGAEFFWIGLLLVGLFAAAIVAGGSLLLWQARQSEAEAAQKTSFVANVSHEFKTPLTTIRLYSEMLEQGRVRDASQGGDYLRTIGREAQRLARLVNNALDFSRLEQGRKKYAREPLDLGVELRRLLDTHEPRLADAGLVLHRAIPDSPLPATTDRDALEQIVLNLLDNAGKYAVAGGEITVTAAARPAGGTAVRVADRGPGVPAEHRAQIFEKFHRVDETLTAEKGGLGLGLSIARQLARGLGGELRYEPRDGGGAEFILEVP
jgi:two-component system phosphate regulon sensor histidine kinase PhoR